MCYYLGNIWASCPDGYRECRCVSPCTYGTIMHPCGVSSRQFVYTQTMAECPCPNCRFRSYQRTRSASSPGDLNEDSGSSETEAGSERCDCADGRGGGCACRSGVLGVQNAEALVVGEELKGVELEEVELEGVEAVQADSRPIKPDRIAKILTDTTMTMGDRPVDPTQLTWSSVQAGKPTELKADGVLGAYSICNHSQVTGQIHRAKTLGYIIEGGS
ncbi:uncharacterized protein EAF02_002154 [Botrytis sinoallii]|uniref:uncharacterized protein n=1 Tax=Botrytis sinoallii TaxID=1463999 RepID=UPI0019028B1F|nr:uncharacterized protein EAF02_002154 [Botrytis sinoallii]KAF7889739.1 hypothetical protein EAF02_002154 [Botrytis sinoallii]